MRKKMFVIVLSLCLVVTGGVVVAAGASSENNTEAAATSTSVEEYEMYLVDGYPDLCVYSMRPNKTLLLIGSSDIANYETYANVNTDKITKGVPVALADDLSAVVVENDEGKFVITTAEGEEAYPDGEPTITPFDEADTSIEWNNLYF